MKVDTLLVVNSIQSLSWKSAIRYCNIFNYLDSHPYADQLNNILKIQQIHQTTGPLSSHRFIKQAGLMASFGAGVCSDSVQDECVTVKGSIGNSTHSDSMSLHVAQTL